MKGRSPTVTGLIEAQAALRPAAIAISHGDREWTYQELLERAESWALKLRGLQLGFDTPVALCAARSPELIAAFLGTLKAGATLLPQDASYPDERRAEAIASARAAVLITDRSPPPGLGREVQVWDLHAPHEALNLPSPPQAIQPEALAYAIYTSGSTRKPKGVGVPHRAFSAFCETAIELFGLGPADRVLQFVSIAFDTSVEEIYPTLAAGARLVLATREMVDPLRFFDECEKSGVTVVDLPTAFWHELVASLTAHPRTLPASLRLVIIGGEAVLPTQVNRWLEAVGPHPVLLNTYGVSEATAIASSSRLASAQEGPVSIGQALRGCQLHVLDSQLHPVKPGDPGQLYIAGAGVAREYLGNPELTAEMFLPDPFGSRGARMYSTGDGARVGRHGELEYLGRLDSQLKIRGVRVEPGEVEARLAEHPAIRAAAVISQTSATQDSSLIGFYVPNGPVTPQALKAFLGRVLPEASVPGVLIPLEALPLLPNQKIDRRALAEKGKGQSFIPGVAPLGAVIEAWCEVLGVQEAGDGDDFFEHGGHSLRAMQLATRILERTGKKISVSDIFNARTLQALTVLVQKATPEAPAPVESIASEADGPRSLTPAQESLLFLRALRPDSAEHHIAVGLKLTGPVDAQALRAALERIVHRHPALQTRFTPIAGRVSPQRVSPAELPWRVVSTEREPLDALVSQEARTPFDLDRAPLFRATLFRVLPQEHVLVLVLHHLVSDDWSVGVLLSELEQEYLAPNPAKIPPRRQRTPGLSESHAQQQEYWKVRLKGAPPQQDLPTDFPRPPNRSGAGATVPVSLSPALSDRLRAFSHQRGASPFMTLLSAYAVLLHRQTGATDLVIGTPTAGRSRTEEEGQVGFFVNMLALRLDLDGKPDFEEVLSRARECTLEAFAHREIPFERVLESLRLKPDPSRTPVFQAVFTFQNVSMSLPRLSGLGVEWTVPETKSAQYDLRLELREEGGSIQGALEFSTDLFERPTMEAFVHQWVVLLEHVLQDPTHAIEAIPLLRKEEREKRIASWSKVLPHALEERCLHSRFEQQARTSPSAIAVTFEGNSLTYGELNARANRLARWLQSQGVSREVPVGLCVDASEHLVTALLAICKAGGAYVPIDPRTPPERLAYVLADAKATLVLCEKTWLPAVKSAACPVHCLEDAALEAKGQPDDDLALDASPAQLAYVIYTSGSTGRPKGTGVSHRNVSRLFSSTQAWFGFGASDVWSLFHSYAFDFSVWELWGALLYGGRLVVVPFESRRSPQAFLQLLRTEKVTVLNQTPSAFRQLIAAARNEGAPPLSLRFVIFGGESLDPKVLKPWYAMYPDDRPRLINMYGITETTVHVTYRPLSKKDTEETVGSPLGVPIPDLQVYLLDSELAPVPSGIRGELFVGGAGVSQGYLGRPDLTAIRFIPDPFAAKPGTRLYRTGDLARTNARGELFFEGRADQQLKIRGFRIELGEIEAVLREHPAVADAAVALFQSTPDDARLMSYLVLHPGQTVAPDAIRTFARSKLPEYMVPAGYQPLPALPITSTGKLDRRALPEPSFAVESEGETSLPSTPLEAALCELWSRQLRIARVGVDSHFFDVGGHSLLVLRLLENVRSEFGVSVDVRAFFSRPTVRHLAQLIEEAAGTPGKRHAALLPDSRNRYEPFPLTDIQQAYWLGRLDAFELGSVAAHVYFEAELEALDLRRLETVIQKLCRRHEMLRAIVLSTGEQQILENTPPFEIPVHDLRDLSPQEAESLRATARARLEQQVLPADRWPLFDVVAFRLKGEKIALHVSIDALHLDAGSYDIVERELFLLYANPEAVLPPIGTSYRDYVLALSGQRQTEEYQRALRYWEARLPTLPPPPELPIRRSATPAVPRFIRRERTLAASQWTRLKQRAATIGVTPSGLLMAAFSRVLATWSKSPRFALNLTFFSRIPLHPDVERLVGDFTSLILLEVDASPASFTELAKTLQQQLWSDLDHRQVSGVHVLRQLAKSAPGRALAPVVFTSTLGLETNDPSTYRGGRITYSITQTPQVWLDHVVSEVAGDLVWNWDAVEDLFPPGTLDDMFAAYGALLEALAEGERPWTEAAALTPADAVALMAGRNATQAPLARERLEAGFLRQAAQRPQHTAVVSSTRKLTYEELHQRSVALADLLEAQGTRAGTLVAIVIPKGWEQIVSALGILSAGAAYLPIDPILPTARIHALLKSGEVKVALTTSGVAPLIEWPEGLVRIEVDTLAPSTSARAPSKGSPEDLAYVLFTSGSTGEPKGVMIDHLGAVNTVRDMNERFEISHNDVVLGLSSLSFDLSVYDVFGTLAAGGTLVLPAPEETGDPERWASLMERERVTVWNSVPALLEMTVELLGDKAVEAGRHIRQVWLSGDWIPVTLPQRVWSLWPRARITSLGGATEASIWSILFPLKTVDPSWTSIPYGHAMKNQTMHVLDEALHPRPAHVPGEIYIGGVGVAKGYWKDPDRTALRFLQHPRTGERLYRTGDWGRMLPDGNLEFLGRDDGQVKVNGHRIELGEIESLLLRTPGIKEAVAFLLTSGDGRKRLGTAVVPVAANTVTADAVRDAVRASLPEYMVPFAVLLLDALPRNSTGKVDRTALSQNAQAQTPHRASPTPVADGVDARVAAVMARLLEVEGLGVDRDFFDAGGDSLIGSRLIVQLRDEFKVELPLRALFEHPTARGLAGAIAKAPSKTTRPGLRKLDR